MAVQGSGPVGYTLTYKLSSVGSFPGPIFFLHFLFVTCLAEKIGFPCTNKACQKKMNAHRLPICISLRAGWVCSSALQPNFRLSLCAWSLGGTMAVQCGGPVVYTLDC